MIKLFAFDLDGTLLAKGSSLPEENIEAIKNLNEAGIKTIIASGRVYSSLAYYQNLIGTNNPLIATNGSMIGKDNENLYKTYYIDDDILIKLYDFCIKYHLYFHFYDKNNYYSNTVNLDKISHLKIDTSFGMNYQVNLNIRENPIEYFLSQGKSTNKFQISIIDNDKFSKNEIKQKIIDEFSKDLYITSSGETMLELMNKDASKWQGICDICDLLGISYDEVATIGDSYNDVPMVKNAKIGFAMGNANNNLKQVADVIVADNNSTGIIEAANYVLKANKDA